MEFNPDGSLKLPDCILKKKEGDDEIFSNEPSIRITRHQISPETPLKCELIIEASDKLDNPEKIKDFYNTAISKFKHMADLSIKKINERKYSVIIISGQFRCSWCESFRRYLKGMNVKIIEWGSCGDYTPSRQWWV